MNYSINLSKFEFTIFIILALLFSFFFQKNFIPAEDATILFRYSENFANTGVISYNLNGETAEGATDFLWMLILSGFYFIGFDTYFASIIINLISLYFVIKLIQRHYSLTRLDFYLLFFFHFTLTQTFAAIAGFSVLFVELILVLVILNFLKKKIFATLVFSFIGCLIRPDFVLFIIIPNFINLIKNFNIRTIKLYLYFIVLGCIYFFLRFKYFDLLFPLPFYIKNQWNIFNNLEWGRQIIILFPSIIILFYIQINKILKKSIIVITSIIFLATSYYTNQILYQNIGYRFYFYFPILTILILYEIQNEYFNLKKIVRTIIFFISISSLIINFSQKFNSISFWTKNEDIYYIANQFNKINEKNKLFMATTEAGLLPYYSTIDTVDLFGLNTKKFAKKPADGKIFKDNNFDIIVINATVLGKNCKELKKNIKDAQSMQNKEAKRSDNWSLFSKKLLSGIDLKKYDAYFLKYPQNIFGNKTSKAYVEISNIINDKKIFKCGSN